MRQCGKGANEAGGFPIVIIGGVRDGREVCNIIQGEIMEISYDH